MNNSRKEIESARELHSGRETTAFLDKDLPKHISGKEIILFMEFTRGMCIIANIFILPL